MSSATKSLIGLLEDVRAFFWISIELITRTMWVIMTDKDRVLLSPRSVAAV